jgi:acyl carrier protein
MGNELEIVRGFLEKRLGVAPEKVTPAAKLAELGVDSMLLLELLFECEEQFGLELARDTPTPKTIGDLLETVDRLRTAKTAQ